MKLPKSWGEITLNQYIQIVEVSAIDMDELDKHVKILSILSGQDEDSILSISLPELKEAIRQVQFIYSLPKPKGIKTSLRIGLNRFEVNIDLKKLSAGEYIDLAELTKDKQAVTSNLHKIIAIFLKPVNWFGFSQKKYYTKNQEGDLIQTLKSRNRTEKLLKDNLMMDEVISLSGFFLNNWDILMKATLRYSEKQNKKMAKNLNKLIEKDLQIFGAGI